MGRGSTVDGPGPGVLSRSRTGIDYPGDGPEDQAMRISHEAIYQALYVQGRGASPS